MLQRIRLAKQGNTLFSRYMSIVIEETPNPNSLKFCIQSTLMDKGTRFFKTPKEASVSPLASSIFDIAGVNTVMYGVNFITVSKSDHAEWGDVSGPIKEKISAFYESDLPIIDSDRETELKHAQLDDAGREEESETVQLIRSVLDTRIRPTVQEDGGDLDFKGFENGVVYIALQGACGTCPSSSVTLKNGVEKMLQYYVAEVERVEQIFEEHEAVSDEQFSRLEKSLAAAKGEPLPPTK